MKKETKEKIIIKIIQSVYILMFLIWALDVNIDSFLTILTNIYFTVLLLIFGIFMIFFLSKYKIKFIFIMISLMLSVRIFGGIAMYVWVAYGIFTLWLMDQRDDTLK